MIGKTLGHYEITGQLGKGGMGEVYRAHDTKLNRDVALKVLPAEFANDPERMGRFKREAQLLASLNHTNIAGIHGLEECEGVRALVMELVEGPTLTDRISKGPISLDEALAIARQIAEALEAAHEKGIIHRDLKPANIKVTPEGIVKVLDFGLAKALAGEAAAADASESPTLSLAATKAGIILGTAAYMSPEQARGSAVDKRCDIWSFGVVLFEMLTGKQFFTGETVSDTLAAVLRSDVDWNLLPGDAPASILTLLRRCLTKDRKQRLQAIGEARIVIDEYFANPSGASVHGPIAVASSRKRCERFAWGSAIVLLAVALAVLGLIHFREKPAEVPETRLQVNTPPTSEPTSLAISPDGRRLVFAASTEGQRRLWLRPLDNLTAQPLAKTEGARFPFWSPDSRSIGFFADSKLKRIDIAGGSPQELATAYDGRGGTWNRDGIIVFAPSFMEPLCRVSASVGEGKPMPVTRFSPGQNVHMFPQFLPDGRHLLFFSGGVNPSIYFGSLDSTGTKRLIMAESPAIYAAPGYLMFVRQGTMFVRHFDAARGEASGDEVPIADSVAFDPTLHTAGFSVSETGMLAYRTGNANGHRLAWFDRSGKEIGTLGTPDEHNPLNPELSPNARQIVIDRTLQGNRDIWLIDTERGGFQRLTSDDTQNFFPIWSHDGNRIVFCSTRKGSVGLYHKASNGTGNEEVLLQDIPAAKFPNDISKDGRFLLYEQNDSKTTSDFLKSGSDLWFLPLSGTDRKPRPFGNQAFDEALGQFSPDGRWVAYVSNQSGRYEVYVQLFPGPSGSSPVSINGGYSPRWRRDGKELFYIAPDGKLMAASFAGAGQTPKIGAPVGLFPTRIVGGGQSMEKQQYVVAPDGRFLINVIADESVTSPITIVTNWARALKK
jgi:eukaryotic-like serine/threonine-protein kinase